VLSRSGARASSYAVGIRRPQPETWRAKRKSGRPTAALRHPSSSTAWYGEEREGGRLPQRHLSRNPRKLGSGDPPRSPEPHEGPTWGEARTARRRRAARRDPRQHRTPQPLSDGTTCTSCFASGERSPLSGALVGGPRRLPSNHVATQTQRGYDRHNEPRTKGTLMATWLWILIIVIVLLAVLGFFGRGRYNR
jgi:hypothetical protein